MVPRRADHAVRIPARAFDADRDGVRRRGTGATSMSPPAPFPSRLRAACWQAALAHAVRHRHDVMRPWESEPHSIAHGILDDETYDWCEIVRGDVRQRRLARSWSPRTSLRRANDLARRRPASTSISPGLRASRACCSSSSAGDARTYGRRSSGSRCSCSSPVNAGASAREARAGPPERVEAPFQPRRRRPATKVSGPPATACSNVSGW